MFRLPLACAFIFTLTTACDNSAAELQDASAKAQQEANTKIAEANAKADQQARNAQAEADKTIAAQSAEFMTIREDYRHQTTLAMVDLDKKVADLEASAKKANAKDRVALEARITTIRAQHTAFMTDFNALDKETGATWDATRARMDAQWADLKARVEAS